jgi:hypothetical protein
MVVILGRERFAQNSRGLAIGGRSAGLLDLAERSRPKSIAELLDKATAPKSAFAHWPIAWTPLLP